MFFYKTISRSLWSIGIFLLFCLPLTSSADIQRHKFTAGGNYLIVELLADDLMHFEYGQGTGPQVLTPLALSDMVCKIGDNVPQQICRTDFRGPQQFIIYQENANQVLETRDLRLIIDQHVLFVTLIDKTKNNTVLTTFQALDLNQATKSLVFTRNQDLDIYGLGQQFIEPDNSDIDWDQRVREGNKFGNVMAGFNGGANGNTQIPVMYAVNDSGNENYAVFLDDTSRQRWDFTKASQWQVELSGKDARFFIMTGPDLLDLRKDFMGLVGHPLVPPKRMFGLWVSEYGYDNWFELQQKLDSLRAKQFPVDGFVLDLQWFGGIPSVTGKCRMGALDFDTVDFANPKSAIEQLKNNGNAGLMLIEEAYVCDSLPEYTRLKNQGCLVTNRPGGHEPAKLCGFWGCGGMIDYTNEACARTWHNDERQKLIDVGVMGHWTDLGEPEIYDENAGYAVGTQADAHNIFNFRWIRSIYQAYQQNNTQQRPFIMSRSGTAGIQRFGAAMWSGDIASRLTSLTAHAANQMHMSFSGIDYYGADIGGFHRNLEGDQDEMYTQWFAYGMMFDIPGRPHVENLCNCKETAPDRIGNLASNLANTRLRYGLIPYIYSLAHRAYLYGEPVLPPLVMYYQTDNNVRSMGHQKLLGRDLLAAIVAKHGETERDVYLPQGNWFDWHSRRKIQSEGIWLPNQRVADNGVFRLPLFARAGAIIPMMSVDEKLLNAMGERKEADTEMDLFIRLFPLDSNADDETSFTLYEDDGTTIAYQSGAVRTTRISQTQPAAGKLSVLVAAADGTYNGAPTLRDMIMDVTLNASVREVQLNDKKLNQWHSQVDFANHPSGWINAEPDKLLIKSGIMSVLQTRHFTITYEESPPCTSRYHSISVPGEGNDWDPADLDRTLNHCIGKRWHGRITLFEEQYKFVADGNWTVNWGRAGQPNGANFPTKAASVYDVIFDETDPANPVFIPIGPPPSQPLRFICENGHTTPGISVYLTGNIEALGAWEISRAIKLTPNGPYPSWTGLIHQLPDNGHVEWKCIKREEQGHPPQVVEWESGENNVVNRAQPDQLGKF